MEPIRVLQVVPAMDCGGMEAFLMNIYRNIDRTQVQFDFLYHYDKPCYFDAEIERLGGRIYRLGIRTDGNLVRYLRGLDAFFAQHPEYTIVHGHYSGFGMFYNHYAKKHGVRVRIGHSHNTSSETGLVGTLDRLMSKPFRYGLTDCFACSEPAGEFLFGNRPFTVVHNGVDTARFAADAQKRAAARAALDLAPDTLALGHIGRFSQQKNHAFLLELFASYHAQRPQSVLLLAGEGALQEEMRARAGALGVGEAVRFLGLRSDVDMLLQAMDAIVFPSLFEGLPVSCIEAQAAGLPCFLADTIAPEVKLTPDVWFLPITQGTQPWVHALCEALPRPRRDTRAEIIAAGYDARTEAQKLQAFYLAHAGAHAAAAVQHAAQRGAGTAADAAPESGISAAQPADAHAVPHAAGPEITAAADQKPRDGAACVPPAAARPGNEAAGR